MNSRQLRMPPMKCRLFHTRAMMTVLVSLALTGCAHHGRRAYAGEIHEAAAKGDVEKVKALLTSDPKLINAKDYTGRTPLCVATEHRYPKVVDLLLAQGAEVNLKETEAPLIIATFLSENEIVEILLAYKADVNVRAKEAMRGG